MNFAADGKKISHVLELRQFFDNQILSVEKNFVEIVGRNVEILIGSFLIQSESHRKFQNIDR